MVTGLRATVWGICLLATGAGSRADEAALMALARQPWYESRSAHFNTYSYAPSQEVAKLTARLEQFSEAYAYLAGTQAVVSPPIAVLVMPSHEASKPLLPLYQGQAANMAGFFKPGDGENLIVMALAGSGSDFSLHTIYHEYSHLLLRANNRLWPVWLKEGMAEIYSTFSVVGSGKVRIGQPIEYHVRALRGGPLMPLRDLFEVKTDSSDYNETQLQERFYAQSWLLTHYLMLGPNAVRHAQFRQLTVLLKQGQTAEQAFTNAFCATLPAMEEELRGYLATGQFAPLEFAVQADLLAPRLMSTRLLTPVEIYFRLGDEQFRLGYPDTARAMFEAARKLAPASPLPYEGLGLLAFQAHQGGESLQWLQQALERHSANYQVYYAYGWTKYRQTANAEGAYGPVAASLAQQVRTNLQASLALMPNYGPAHYQLGFLEVVQRENLAEAEAQLQAAVRLEPDRAGYWLTLAQTQILRQELEAARRNLLQLCRPYIEEDVRKEAAKLFKQLESGGGMP